MAACMENVKIGMSKGQQTAVRDEWIRAEKGEWQASSESLQRTELWGMEVIGKGPVKYYQ